MKEVIIAVLWLVMGIINYKVFEEDDILARNLFAFCTFIFPNYLDNNSIKNPVCPIWIAKKCFSNKKCNKNIKKR